ncbi:hypothetical protein ES288_D03G046900v1 [Gossypium darwinii]|nr:hypothetical protein ES288_D03G046900v1 [Gossypium darwinii]
MDPIVIVDVVVPLATSNVAINLIASATASFAINVVANIVAMPMLPDISYAKPFPTIFKFEVFDGDNFKRWNEYIFSILDMHRVAFALTKCKQTNFSVKQFNLWVHANK